MTNSVSANNRLAAVFSAVLISLGASSAGADVSRGALADLQGADVHAARAPAPVRVAGGPPPSLLPGAAPSAPGGAAALPPGAPAAATPGMGKVDLVNRKVLRVCSDPANMPFSNDKGEGFENKIADIVGSELKVPVEYVYYPMATGFIRRTLSAKVCDIVIGYAQGDEMVLNTNAYYRTTYALVYRAGQGLDGVTKLTDPRLQGKRVGVIAGTPPANIMAKAGLMALAKPYRLVVDRRFESPSEDMVKDIRSGEISAGVLWGPMAGYFAQHGGDKLTVVPIGDEGLGSSRLAFRITMGVRNGEDDWKRQLNTIIAKRQADINKVLLDYGVPILDEQNNPIKTTQP